MQMSAYRLTVVGTLVSSFMVGLHVPALHEMVEHDASPHWGVLAATLVLVVLTVAGAWTLLRDTTHAQ
jgi:hypothetical protein